MEPDALEAAIARHADAVVAFWRASRAVEDARADLARQLGKCRVRALVAEIEAMERAPDFD